MLGFDAHKAIDTLMALSGNTHACCHIIIFCLKDPHFSLFKPQNSTFGCVSHRDCLYEYNTVNILGSPVQYPFVT